MPSLSDKLFSTNMIACLNSLNLRKIQKIIKFLQKNP